MAQKIHIGCSGWQYDHWKGLFYPIDIPKKNWLPFYKNHFDTVEINASFYHLPRKTTFEKWKNEAGENFLFTVKGSRFVTHIKKLNDPKESTQKFYDHAAYLEEKIGAILWQLPPQLHSNEDKLTNYCKILDKNFKNIIEFRHLSWFKEKYYEILSKFNTGLCIVSAYSIPERFITTCETAYIRFHGLESNWYKYNYSDKELNRYAKKIKLLDAKEIYVYFNNDFEAQAVKNALKLKKLLET
jgi:uncharacterized protein YecE (DUF72 family)